MTPRVPLIVGEAPNRRGEGKRANTTLTGGRIARLADGARDLPRTNLLREWQPRNAAEFFRVLVAKARLGAL